MTRASDPDGEYAHDAGNQERKIRDFAHHIAAFHALQRKNNAEMANNTQPVKLKIQITRGGMDALV
ncbi:MAG: hypothetical protein P1U83_04800 [Roseovarius sp.]|nr:hypothetical protein [Roseovarius sp.]